jgi:hypothetical protein
MNENIEMEKLARRAAACKHWRWRIGMAALAANDKARLFLPGCDLPIGGEGGEVGVRLISHTYSEARYAFSESDAVRRAHEKAYVTMHTNHQAWVTMLTNSDPAFNSAQDDNEDNVSGLYAVGFTHLENLLPDFYDTVTARGLLQVVRAAWLCPSLHTRLGVDGWEVRDTYCTEIDGKPTTVVCGLDWKGAGGEIDPNGAHGSEIEALVVALEAAPAEKPEAKSELSSNALHLEKIARFALSCSKWRWLSGMKVAVPAAHKGDTGYYRILISTDEPEAGAYPDFSDPATLGCLLSLVREAWGVPTISTRHSEYTHGSEWDVPVPTIDNRVLDVIFFKGKSEAAALVHALNGSENRPPALGEHEKV